MSSLINISKANYKHYSLKQLTEEFYVWSTIMVTKEKIYMIQLTFRISNRIGIISSWFRKCAYNK